MHDLVTYVFLTLGLLMIGALAFIDRKYPSEDPIPNIAYIGVIVYMSVLMVGPKGMRSIATKIVDKADEFDFSNFTISLGKKGQEKKK